MDFGTYAVFSSLLAGSVHGVLLWRASIGVDVVNVVVLSALAEGRGRELGSLLRGSGSAPYLDVARAIGESALELPAGATQRELRKPLEHVARVAVMAAGQRLRRHAWLDFVSLAALAYAGIDAAIYGRATPFKAVALLAATLLCRSHRPGRQPARQLQSAPALAVTSDASCVATAAAIGRVFGRLDTDRRRSAPSPALLAESRPRCREWSRARTTSVPPSSSVSPRRR